MDRQIEELKERLKQVGITFDLPSLQDKLEEYREEMNSPDFWDNPDQARVVSQKADRIEDLITRYKEYEEQLEEIEFLLELARQEEDEEELARVEKRIEALAKRLDDLELEVFMDGQYDPHDCYLSINAGAGGNDAQDWAEMLLRMYTHWLDKRDFEYRFLDRSEGEVAGVKSVTLEVQGDWSYGYLKGEKGVHRLVRISPFDSAGRRHTSFASVNVVPEFEDDVEVDIEEKDLKIDTYRSSGAGGQHVNVTDSAVRITHEPSGLVVTCQNERSQHKNKRTALKILKSRLYQLKLEERAEKLEDIQGELRDIEWGNQIRSYVLHPYTKVKDHRTDVEAGNAEGVLDGELDVFIEAYLRQQSS
ncbi:MAG: peptide chain release factor 2 [Candidatus Acetothermia bacterium]